MNLQISEVVKSEGNQRLMPFIEQVNLLRQQFSGLTIAGVEDKEGYKSAQNAAKTIRQERLSLQRKSSAFASDIRTLLSGFQDASKKTIAQYQELENEIRAELRRVDDEKREIKEREERESLERFAQRTDLLFEVGFVFDGYNYKVGTVFCVSGDISDMTDDAFNELVEKGRAEVELLTEVFEESEPVFEELPEADNLEKVSLPIKEMGAIHNKEISVRNIPIGIGDDQEKHIVQASLVSPDPSFRPPGYTAGFDACRNMILEILSSEQKFTREELKNRIINLKP